MTFFKDETQKWQINHIMLNKTAQSKGAKRIFNMFALYSLSDGEIDRFMINEQTGFELASISIFTNVKSNMRKICYLFL